MRLAGTWKQYSKNAIAQLRTTTTQSGLAFSRSEAMCPYQAKVMKTFEMSSSSAVFTALSGAAEGTGLLLRQGEPGVPPGLLGHGRRGLLGVFLGQQGEVAQ